MNAEEFEKYKGKETFGRDEQANIGEYVFDGGVIVGYAPDELFDGQSLLTKVKCDGECYDASEPDTIMCEDVEEGYSYLWCWRKNVKL